MTILSILQDVLGPYQQQRDEYLFSCAFCHHPKKKLSINIAINKWKCWTCGAHGGHIIWLLKQLNLSKELLQQCKRILGDADIKQYKATTSEVKLFLPPEYKPLWKPDTIYPYHHAINYLQKRGITTDDILRYRIGYCTEGTYANRIILPSYDGNNQLNYFTARLFYPEGMKYKNPPVSKNVVIFENMVDYSEKVILCEGMFDAIALRRNAIPLMGKSISKQLVYTLVKHNVPEVIIFLDVDARQDALQLERKLQQLEIKTRLVLTEGKDASEMGFDTSWTAIGSANTTNFKQFIEQRLAIA